MSNARRSWPSPRVRTEVRQRVITRARLSRLDTRGRVCRVRQKDRCVVAEVARGEGDTDVHVSRGWISESTVGKRGGPDGLLFDGEERGATASYAYILGRHLSTMSGVGIHQKRIKHIPVSLRSLMWGMAPTNVHHLDMKQGGSTRRTGNERSMNGDEGRGSYERWLYS